MHALVLNLQDAIYALPADVAQGILYALVADFGSDAAAYIASALEEEAAS